MTSFRKIYREIDAQDKAASHFIDAVLLTARQARDLEITRQLETKTWVFSVTSSSRYHISPIIILEFWTSFKALPQSSRDYLIAKLPALKSLVSSFTEKPPYGLETSSPTSVTRSSPTSSTMVTAITSPRLSELEAKKLLESAIGDLEKSSKQSSSAFSYRFQPIIAALRNIGNNPLSSSLGDFKKVFEQYRKSAQRLLHWCNKLHTPDCEAVSLSWSSTLRQILKAAVAADPTNSRIVAEKVNKENIREFSTFQSGAAEAT
ncbi:hypothetical protein OSTOST_14367, partial [Ostertagia ostertagi]